MEHIPCYALCSIIERNLFFQSYENVDEDDGDLPNYQNIDLFSTAAIIATGNAKKNKRKASSSSASASPPQDQQRRPNSLSHQQQTLYQNIEFASTLINAGNGKSRSGEAPTTKAAASSSKAGVPSSRRLSSGAKGEAGNIGSSGPIYENYDFGEEAVYQVRVRAVPIISSSIPCQRHEFTIPEHDRSPWQDPPRCRGQRQAESQKEQQRQ